MSDGGRRRTTPTLGGMATFLLGCLAGGTLAMLVMGLMVAASREPPLPPGLAQE